MNKTAFVYIWTNIVNGRKYLGSHWGTETDGYMGSGIAFRNAIKFYGPDQFVQEIVEYTTREQRLIREQHWLDELDVCKNPQFYNISGSASGGRTMEGKSPAELTIWRQKCRQSQLQRQYVPTAESKEKMSAASRQWWSSMTQEERSARHAGENNPMYGTTRNHNEVTRQKMSIAQNKRYTKSQERKRCGRVGRHNANARAITIDGVVYSTHQEATRMTGLTGGQLRRLKEKNDKRIG